MKLVSQSLVFLFLFVGLTFFSLVVADEDESNARLKIEVQPRQGFTPLLVTFHATLEGVDPDDEEFFCLKQEWDFGDGAVSTEELNCDPSSETTKVETEFFAQHEYEDPGTYHAFFTLGDKKVISRKAQVTVVFSNRGRASAALSDVVPASQAH